MPHALVRAIVHSGLAIVAVTSVMVLMACGRGEKSAWRDSFDRPNGKLNVVTTVAPISSIVRNVGGDRINLYGIIPDGVDSHTFEPKPSDAKILAKADLVIVNGLHLETPTEELTKANLKPGAKLQRLGDNTISRAEWIFDFSFPASQGDPNPHLWMNVDYARKYADLTRQWLSEMDPKNRDYYEENYRRYKAVLDELDQTIFEVVRTIPEENRKLLTYHDSWAYFARRYGMTVIGAVQPSDFKEPSPQEVAALIDQIRKERVPAVFGSEVFPSKVLKQIAKETGARYIDKLRDDEPPGKPGDRNRTYVGMLIENVRIIAEALGGNAAALQRIDPADTYVKSW